MSGEQNGGDNHSREKCVCRLDRLPVDLIQMLNRDYGIVRRTNGDWVCINPIDRKSRSCRILNTFLRHLWVYVHIWNNDVNQEYLMFPMNLQFQKTVENILRRYEKSTDPEKTKYLLRIESTSLYVLFGTKLKKASRTFTMEKDICGNLSFQPLYDKVGDQIVLLP